MKQRACITLAAVLWTAAITSIVWAFADQHEAGLFEAANTVALIACVPTFYLVADGLLARYHWMAERDRARMLGDLAEITGRGDSLRSVPRDDH